MTQQRTDIFGSEGDKIFNDITAENVTVNGNFTIDGVGSPNILIDEIKDDDTLSGNSATALVTEQAIKAYVDNKGTTQTIFVPAAGMISRSTDGAVPGTVESNTNKVMSSTMDFQTAADKHVQFTVQMPKSWDAGTVTAQFLWSHPATTVNFGVRFFIQAMALSNDDALDTAFGTAVGHTADTGGTTDDIYFTDVTSAITIGNSPAKSDYVVFQVYRDVSDAGDTLAVDARLHGVSIFYTTDTPTDA